MGRTWPVATAGLRRLRFHEASFDSERVITSGRFEVTLNNIRFANLRTAISLSLLTAAALVVHGYHPFVEDAEIYLPGVERILNPKLFPVGREFFESHASMTLFPNLLAGFFRITHLDFETGLFLWHVASIFLLLLACWELSGLLFSSASSRWGAVCLIAGLLTIPVSGTALYIMDQYLNPRSLATFAAVFSIARLLERKYIRVLFWLLFAACVHPLMWVFPFSFCALWIVLEKCERQLWGRLTHKSSAVPVGLGLFWIPVIQDGSAKYQESARTHAYFYIQHWAWYEWLGVIAPLIVFWYVERLARRRQALMLARVSRAFAIYGLIYFGVALTVDLPARFDRLARIQPMRSLHLEYIFLFLCIGGLMGQYVLKDRTWRWIVLFIPLCLGMFLSQRALFERSAHVEWPGRAPRNEWAQAFLWIRENTPRDAVFALNPEYMSLAGEDEIGFRCLAQRNRLADAVKDNGVVSMFPQLSEEWWAQVQAQSAWKDLQMSDFMRLKQQYGVSWIVLEKPRSVLMTCPYQNGTLEVCELP